MTENRFYVIYALTWLNRASAFRTCDSSLIGSRRRPRESTYAKALFGNFARFFRSPML